MEKEFESKNRKFQIERYHLNFLSTLNLEKDPRFIYLKSQLHEFYLNVYSNQQYSTNPLKPCQWNKNLHHSLNVLLSELVLTSNHESQLTLLDKAYKWYLNNLTNNPTEVKIPSPNLSTNIRNISLPTIDAVKPTQLSPIENSPLYFPKPHRVNSKQNIINSSEAKYIEMLKEEKIEFNTSKHRKKIGILRSKTPNIPVSNSEPENEGIHQNNSKTPEVCEDEFKFEKFVTPSFDFRANNRFRHVEGIDKNKMFFRMPNDEMKKINIMKKKFAKKKIKVDSKILEFAIRSKECSEDKTELFKFPIGGEMLMRYKKIKSKVSSTKKSKKKKNSDYLN